MIEFQCPGCGAAYRVAEEKAGKTGACPQCKSRMTVPTLAPTAEAREYGFDAPPESSAAPANAATDPGGKRSDRRAEDRPAPEPPVAPPAPAPGDTPCPGCQDYLPDGAKLCARCGIRLPSGRPLLTRHDEDTEDIVVDRTEKVLRWVSWIIPWGILPVYSTAPGRMRPITIWLIFSVTVVVGILQIPLDMRAYQLWAGDPAARETQIQQEVTKFRKKNPSVSQEQARDFVVTYWYGQAETYHPYQLVTHAFLHAGVFHLVANMLFLLVFGTRINSLIGNTATALFYLVMAVGAGLAWKFEMETTGAPLTPMVGASGAIMGLCGMYFVLFPVYKVFMAAWWRWGFIGGFRLHHTTFPLGGVLVVGGYIAFDILWLTLGADSTVAHSAHVGGFVVGMLIGTVLLLTRLVNSPGNLFSVAMGKYSWAFVGRPREGQGILTQYAPGFLRSKQ